MLKQNPLKEKIQAQKTVLGTWNTLGNPLVTEVLARAGLDFVIIDFEHGPYQLDQVHLYVDKCELFGCSPLVRIPSNSDWMVLQALDQGAHGVIVPHINSAKEAQKLAETTKYFPHGNRGFTPFTKAGGFTNQGSEGYSDRANSLILTSVIIESKEALENLDQMLSVPGIDIFYFGAYDLSREFGCPGNTKSDKVVGAIKQGVQKVRAAGKCAGGFVPQSKEEIKWVKEIGISFLTYQVDSSALYESYHSVVDWMKREETQ